MGNDGSKYEEENKQLTRDLHEKSTESALKERDIRHLNEKLQEDRDRLEREMSDRSNLQRRYEDLQQSREVSERDLIKSQFEIKVMDVRLDQIKERLESRQRRLDEKTQELRQIEDKLDKVKEEKHQARLEAAKSQVEVTMLREQNERDRINHRETLAILHRQQDRDDKNTKMICSALENMSIAFQRNNNPAIDTRRNTPLYLQGRRQRRRHEKVNLPGRITVVFCPKDGVQQQFRHRTNEDDELEDFLDDVVKDYGPLADAVGVLRGQNIIEVIHAAGYSLLTVAPDENRWTLITSHDDICDLVEDHPSLSRRMTMYVVHDDEKEARLEEVLPRSSAARRASRDSSPAPSRSSND